MRACGVARYKPPMSSREHEALDIYEMERMVARALVELVDDRARPSISVKTLASRTGLPARRVREVTDAWNLRTLSGDELYLTPDAMDKARELAE